MLIEPNKFYLTRKGDQVFVEYVRSKCPFKGIEAKFQVIGWHEQRSYCVWKLDGSYNLSGESPHDLVSRLFRGRSE